MKTANSVQQIIAGTSTAVINLGAATSGCRTLAAAIGATGSVLTVGLAGVAGRAEDDAGNWLNGRYTLTSTGQVTRTSISSSSAGGGDVTLSGTVRKFSLIADADDLNGFLSAADGIAPSALASAGAAQSSDILVITRGGAELVLTAGALAALAGAPLDTIAPTATASAVANSAPTLVLITMSEALNSAFVPAASAFTVGGHTVSSVAISGASITLTLASPFVNGEAARTLAYTQPGTNNARDAAGNLLANFSRAVINNVGDATAPAFASAQVLNSAPTVIAITMDEALNSSFVPAASAFSVSGGKTVTGVAISGQVVSLTCSAAYANGDTITAQYIKPSSGNTLRDAAGNASASFGPTGVTNNVQPATPGLVYQFNGPAYTAFTTSKSFGGGSNVGIVFDYIIRTADGQYFDNSAVDVYALLSTSATVMPRANDSEHAGLVNAVVVSGRLGSDASTGGYYGCNVYAYRSAGDLSTRYLWVEAFVKGADLNTATPIFAAAYDGNHTGTPTPITFTA